MGQYTDAQIADMLNRAMPANTKAQLGTVLYAVINNFNALLTALDAANITNLGTGSHAAFAIATPANMTGSADI